MNFAHQHLMSAVKLALKVRDIEVQNIDTPWDGSTFFEDLMACSTGTIMTTVAALEAFLGELQFEPETRFNAERHFLIECFKLVEWKPIVERVKFFATINGRSPPDMGRRPGQDIRALIDLRNALVHFEPEWFGQQEQHRKLSTKLQNKFSKCKWLSDDPIFPRAWASYSCCKWAVNSMRDFIIAYATANNWECSFLKSATYFQLP